MRPERRWTPATSGLIVLLFFVAMFLILVVTMVVKRQPVDWFFWVSLFGVAMGAVAYIVGRRNTPR